LCEAMAEVERPIVFGGFSFGNSADADHHAAENHEDDAEDVPAPPSVAPGAGFKRRQTVSAEVYNASQEESFDPEKYPKSAEDTEKLIKLLEAHYLFRHLDDRELARLVELFEPRSYKPGESLSDDAANAATSHFHVIMEGECELKGSGDVVKSLGPLSTVGETEMMYTQPCSQSAVAKTDVRSFCIDRRTYQRTLHSTFAKKRALYCEFLKNVKFLEGLSRREMVQLADCLEACKFKEGEGIIHFEAPPDAMYIIMEGTVKVVGRDSNNNKIDVCEFTQGAIVGEMEFLNNHNNVADVVAKSEEVRAARLERKHFELCMGSLKDLLQSSRQVDPVYDYYRQKRATTHVISEAPVDPEVGHSIDVTSFRLPYTYAGQIKSLMKEGEVRVTLNGLGRAAETAVSTANRLQEAKLVTLKRIATYMSARGVAGIRIVLDKAPDFDTAVKTDKADTPDKADA